MTRRRGRTRGKETRVTSSRGEGGKGVEVDPCHRGKSYIPLRAEVTGGVELVTWFEGRNG